jgi:hypothetical protein
MRLVVACFASLLLACAEGGGDPSDLDTGPGGFDAGRRDTGGMVDAGGRDAGRPRDAGGGRDAGPPGMDAGPRDAGPPAMPDAGMTCMPASANLAIVEVMVASASGSSDRGEWFEVMNFGDCTVALAGMVIESPTSTGMLKTHMVTGGFINPGQHFVFALSGAPAENHGLPHDYVYGTGGADDVILNNGADSLTLRAPSGAMIDVVMWPSGGFNYAHSRQFPSTLMPVMNDAWSRFCDSTVVYSTMGGMFYGTPQVANGTCP